MQLDTSYRVDLIVEDVVVVETKAVAAEADGRRETIGAAGEIAEGAEDGDYSFEKKTSVAPFLLRKCARRARRAQWGSIAAGDSLWR